jgi:hypothetical protein
MRVPSMPVLYCLFYAVAATHAADHAGATCGELASVIAETAERMAYYATKLAELHAQQLACGDSHPGTSQRQPLSIQCTRYNACSDGLEVLRIVLERMLLQTACNLHQ